MTLFKEVLIRLLDGVAAMGFFAPVVFFGGYAAATTFFVPTLILNLSAGALFGVPAGFAAAYGGALAGASAVFLAGRSLSRRRVLEKAASSRSFHALDAAVAERGWKIVLLLRLAGILPFTFMNYGLGLTKIRFRDYFLASAAGMAPGTLLYVYLGSAAGKLVLEKNPFDKTPLEWTLTAFSVAATLGIGAYAACIVRKTLFLTADRTSKPA